MSSPAEIAKAIVDGCQMNYGSLVAGARAWLLKWIEEAIRVERDNAAALIAAERARVVVDLTHAVQRVSCVYDGSKNRAAANVKAEILKLLDAAAASEGEK